MNAEATIPAPESNAARALGALRLAALAGCLLAVVLLQDPSCADLDAPKTLWFDAALGLLPALTALRLWWGAPLRLPSRGVLLALASLAAAWTLAAYASPLPARARPVWQAGLMAVLVVVSAADIAAAPAGRRTLLRTLTVAAGLAGAWSLAQRLGLDPGPAALAERAAFGGRVAGCLGNPNFAGGFFALVLPLLAHQALAAEGRAWRVGARFALAAALSGLALGAGKASILGLLAAAAVAGHLLFWSRADPGARRRALRGLGAGLLLGLAAAAFLLPSASRRRLAGGPAAWDHSVSFRERTWRGAWAMARARPLTGWGPGTFSAAYPPFRPPRTMASQVHHAYEVTAPENWPLQFLDESGILGLAAFAALLGVILAPLRRRARGWAEDPAGAGLCLALVAALAGSLACNLASLDLFLPSTLLPWLLLLGLGSALGGRGGAVLTLEPQRSTRLLVSLGLAFLAGVPLVQGLLGLEASRLLASGRALSLAGRPADAARVYVRAVEDDPDLLEARYFLGRSLMDAGGASGKRDARAAFQALRLYAPDYVQVHLLLGRLDEAQGRPADAAQEYARQLALDPWDREAFQAQASLLARAGRLAEVRALLAGGARRWPQDKDIARNLAAVDAALARRGRRR